MDIKTFKQMLKASFKSDDTEETIDVYFTRPIGLAFALLCRKLKVTPNMVTYLSMVLGIASGVMFYYTDLTHNIIGILLLMMILLGLSHLLFLLLLLNISFYIVVKSHLILLMPKHMKLI